MPEKPHKWVYVIIVAVIVALAVAGVLVYHDQKVTKEAKKKAKELVTKLHAAGLDAPTEAAAARLYGVDGGPFAGTPDASLDQAKFTWWHGTAGPASRPVALTDDFVQAARIFVSVYLPDKMKQFEEYISGLQTTDSP